MSPINLLSMFSTVFKSKPFYCSIVSIAVFLTAMQINNLNINSQINFNLRQENQKLRQLKSDLSSQILDSRIEYPWRIILYALQGTSTHDEVIAEVRKWFDLKWGAQIQAVYIVCHYDRKRFLTILNEDETSTICRMSN